MPVHLPRTVVVTHVPPLLHVARRRRGNMRRGRRETLLGAVAGGVGPAELRQRDVVGLSLHHRLSVRRLISRGRVLLMRWRRRGLVMGVLDVRVPLWLMLSSVIKVLRRRWLMRRVQFLRTVREVMGRVREMR